MNPKPLSEALDPDLRASVAAIRRAALAARELAIQTNTGIVIMRDGEVVYVTADELRRRADE